MALKILHTSDWHLGKKLFKTSRLEEQKLFLQWLENEIVNKEIDALIIAGDLFDSPNPPTEALKLFYDFIQSSQKKRDYHILAIAGNHDSGKLLTAPSALYDKDKVHIVGFLNEQEPLDPSHYTFTVKDVDFILLPYFRTYEILNLQKKLALTNEQQLESEAILNTLELFLQHMAQASKNHSKVLVAHHLFGRYELSGSELGLSLSGLDTIPLKTLKDHFQYVALGHIHKTQMVQTQDPITLYPGSPIPFRFSETQNKNYALIDFINQQSPKVSLEKIPSFRRLAKFQAEAEDLEAQLDDFIALEKEKVKTFPTLVEAHIQMNESKVGLADYIREQFKDLPLELISFSSSIKGQKDQQEKEHLSSLSDLSTEKLFEHFYLQKYPESENIPPEIVHDFHALLDEYRQGPKDSQELWQ